MKIISFALCLLLAAIGRTQTPPPAVSDLLLGEPLATGAPEAKDVAGGVFEQGGWKAVKETDHLYYELPEGLLMGTVEFEVKGIRVGLAGDPRKHPFLLSDVYLGPGAYYNVNTATTIVLRVWTNPRDGSAPGKMRLRTIGSHYEGAARDAKFQADSAALQWDPTRWYKMRIRWTQTEAVFELDGVRLLRIAYPDRQVQFRHLFLNTSNYGIDMHGLHTVVYRNLRVTSPQAPALKEAAAKPLVEATAMDLQVLPDAAAGGRRLWTYLLGEAQQQFKQRRIAVEQAVLRPGGMSQRREELRAAYRQNLGWLPDKSPLNPSVTRTLAREGYRIENLAFESRPRHRVTANLYVPSSLARPAPAVLLLCGHSEEGKAAPAYQSVAISLVRLGFVVLVPDPIAQGERLQFLTSTGKPAMRGGTTTHTVLEGIGRLVDTGVVAHEVWDNIRAIDYLESRPEVDARRIGVTGTSGGGAMTTFLVGVEERVQAAAVSCFVNPRPVMFAKEGPYDGCAHLPNEGALGHDHADYLFMHAPKPVLILGAQQDYKDIAGVWQAYRELKRGYIALGFADRAEIFESTDGHGFFPAHRQAVAHWLKRWLLDDDDPVIERPIQVEKREDLLVTKSGQVAIEWADEALQQEIYLARAQELAAQRDAHWRSERDPLAEVKRLAGIRPVGKTIVEQRGAFLRTVGGTRLRIDKMVLRTEGEVPVPALLFAPERLARPVSATVYVDGRGKAAEAGPGGALEKLAAEGRIVLAIDARGYGETADDPSANDKKYLNREFRTAMLAGHIGRPLIGQRAGDILAAVEMLAKRSGVDASRIEMIAEGAAGPAAMHAAAVEPRVIRLTLQRSLASWIDMIQAARAPDMLAQVVPGALTRYDLPDLVRAIAPREVRLIEPLSAVALVATSPTDATGTPWRASKK